MIWQVVPLSRMQYAREVVQRFNAQTYSDKRLCLVVNGTGLSAVQVQEQFKRMEIAPDLLLQTASHPQFGKPWALNRALLELPGELIALRDDDDIQGPKDLEEAVEAYRVTRATIVSKHPHQVLVNEQRWLFAEELANQWAKRPDGSYDCRVSGSNVLFQNRGVPKFPEVPSGEVRSWTQAMIDQGASIWRTSIENYTWVRGKHTHRWRATMASLRDEYGRGLPAKRFKHDGTFDTVQPPTAMEIMNDFGNWL